MLDFAPDSFASSEMLSEAPEWAIAWQAPKAKPDFPAELLSGYCAT